MASVAYNPRRYNPPRGYSNPLFLPKSLFDSYIVKSDGNEVSVDKIQTLSGAERKVRELARKYPCVGFSITSAKHGGTIKHYPASVGRGLKVDEDNSRQYLRDLKAKLKTENPLIAQHGNPDSTWYRGSNSPHDSLPRGSVVWLTKSKKYASGYGSNISEFSVANSRVLDMRRETNGFGAKWVEFPVSEWDKKLARKRVRLNVEGVADLSNEETTLEGLFDASAVSISNASDLDAENAVKRAGYDAVRYYEPERGGDKNETLMVLDPKALKLIGRANPLISQQSSLRPSAYPGIRYGLEIDVTGRGHWEEVGLYGKRGEAEKEGRVIQKRDGFPYRVKGTRDTRSKEEKLVRREFENPISFGKNPVMFPTERAALAFSRKHPGSHVVRGQRGWLVMYSLRNPEPGTLPKVHYGLSQSNASYNRAQAMKALKAGMTPEEIHAEWPRVWGINDGKLFQHYDAEFAGHPGVYETKVSMANVSEIIAKYKKSKRVKRNPDDSLSSAESLYSQFHGEPSDGETIYEETIEIPDRFVELGDLTEMKVATLLGKEATICAPDPDRYDLHEIVKLASSPDGNQLYFLGGDQKLELDKLGFKNGEVKPHMFIGVLIEVTYRTRKGFDKFKLTDYYHGLGEETGNQPMLTYDHTNGLMSVVGGEYHVRDVGIVN